MRRFAVILAFLPAVARTQGPIDNRNNEATSLVFLRFEPRGSILQPGEHQIAFDLSSANSLRLTPTYREDQETERLGVRMRWGVARGEWAVEVPFLSRGGGFQDPLIEGWHELIGIHNFRKTIPYGREEETIPGGGSFGGESGLGDISGTYSRALGPNAFVAFGLKLPTGNAGGLLGSGGVDAGVSFYQHWKLARHWNLYGQLAGVFQGPATRLDHTRSLIDQESLSIEFRANSRDAYVLQHQGEPSAQISGNQLFDGPHRQVSFGYSRRLSHTDTIQLYFIEDGDFLNYRVPALVNIAPDFSIGINITRRF